MSIFYIQALGVATESAALQCRQELHIVSCWGGGGTFCWVFACGLQNLFFLSWRKFRDMLRVHTHPVRHPSVWPLLNSLFFLSQHWSCSHGKKGNRVVWGRPLTPARLFVLLRFCLIEATLVWHNHSLSYFLMTLLHPLYLTLSHTATGIPTHLFLFPHLANYLLVHFCFGSTIMTK